MKTCFNSSLFTWVHFKLVFNVWWYCQTSPCRLWIISHGNIRTWPPCWKLSKSVVNFHRPQIMSNLHGTWHIWSSDQVEQMCQTAFSNSKPFGRDSQSIRQNIQYPMIHPAELAYRVRLCLTPTLLLAAIFIIKSFWPPTSLSRLIGSSGRGLCEVGVSHVTYQPRLLHLSKGAAFCGWSRLQ